jgi:hypothetical protein
MMEQDRLRQDALLDAQRIREDATEDAAKLLSTLNTERDFILADARDDARRIIDGAHDAIWVDDAALPPTLDPQPWGQEPEVVAEDVADGHPLPPSGEGIWVDVADGDDSAAPDDSESGGIWKRRRRKWYQRSR